MPIRSLHLIKLTLVHIILGQYAIHRLHDQNFYHLVELQWPLCLIVVTLLLICPGNK